MGTGAIATGDKGIFAFRNGGKGIQHGGSILYAGRIGFRAAKYKIVVQEGKPRGVKALQGVGVARVNKILFLALGMHQDQIRIAILGGGDGLAGTGGLDLYRIAVFLFEYRQQVAEQAGVVDGSGGG